MSGMFLFGGNELVTLFFLSETNDTNWAICQGARAAGVILNL